MLHFRYVNEIYARIEFDEASRRDFDTIREYFKTENAAASFSKNMRFKMSPFVYAISPLGKYSLGMTADICKICRGLGVEYEIEDMLQQTISPGFGIEDIVSVPNESYKYRDYQLQLIQSLSDNGRRCDYISDSFW